MSERGGRGVVESLVLVAGSPPDEVTRAVDRLGAEPVADTVVAEIASRCLPLPDLPKVTVQLDLVHGGDRFSHLFAVSEHGVAGARGTDPEAPMWISYELADLVRAVYGPSRCRAGHTRRVELRLGREAKDVPPDPKAWLLRMDPVSRATQVLLAAIDPGEPDLGELAVRYGTDKWGGLHWFTPHYQRHFAGLRDEPVRILEIGIGGYERPDLGGGSLRTWKRYFRRGLVYGLDIFDKSGLDEPRITTIRGDQSDAEFMRSLGEEHGPFDVVIDDGSHFSEHIIGTLHTLFPFVRAGGYYVVEDLQWSYSPGYGGDATRFDSPHTSVGFLKTLVDGLHYEDVPRRKPQQPTYLEQNVGAVHFYRGIAFIEKSVNSEGSIPPWIPRSAAPPS